MNTDTAPVVVTGANRGIGLSIVAGLVEAGVHQHEAVGTGVLDRPHVDGTVPALYHSINQRLLTKIPSSSAEQYIT